jgi:Zn-dependent protease with chaperone function
VTRLSLLVGAFAVLSAFGSTFGRLRAIPPAWRVRFGFVALTGLLMATVALLAAILLPEVLVLRSVRDIWTACTAAFHFIWRHPFHRLASITAGLALALLIGRFVWAVAGSILATRRTHSTLVKATRRHADDDVFVLDVDHPEAFSVGGRRGLVVVTRGLLEVLDEDERHGVVLHEEGHLRSRHHVLLGLARATACAMAPFPAARLALEAMEQAVEEAADEYAAVRLGSGVAVASGLSKAALAGLRAPVGSLSIGDGPDIPARVRRLLAPPSAPPWVPIVCLIGVVTLLGMVLATQYVAGLAVVAAVHHLLGLGTAMSCPLFR